MWQIARRADRCRSGHLPSISPHCVIGVRGTLPAYSKVLHVTLSVETLPACGLSARRIPHNQLPLTLRISMPKTRARWRGREFAWRRCAPFQASQHNLGPDGRGKVLGATFVGTPWAKKSACRIAARESNSTKTIFQGLIHVHHCHSISMGTPPTCRSVPAQFPRPRSNVARSTSERHAHPRRQCRQESQTGGLG